MALVQSRADALPFDTAFTWWSLFLKLINVVPAGPMLSQELAGRAQSILGRLNLNSHSPSPEFTDSQADFAIHLEHVLNNKANLAAQDFPDFSSYLAILPLQRKDLSPGLRVEFDRKGVALWNKCCNLDSSDASQSTRISLAKGGIHDLRTQYPSDTCRSENVLLFLT
jgi:hypothetical protein